jgi:Glycosyltransferase family 10 (fucosyltransferase) C-term
MESDMSMKIFSNFMPKDLYEKCAIRNEAFILPPRVRPSVADKSISIFNDYTPKIDELWQSSRNILVILEPNQLFGLHDWAILNHKFFHVILTWSTEILEKCPNSILLPFGTSYLWETPDFYTKMTGKDKKFNVSFLCGQKNVIEGHQLRHKILASGPRVAIDKLWLFTCPPGAGKNQCWNSMFHVAVENSRNKNYFTEKVIDAFLTRTVPLYWGCPNLADYFNKDGFITFENEEDLIQKINCLTEKDYHDRAAAIEENYQKALYYGDFFYRFNETVDKLVDTWRL